MRLLIFGAGDHGRALAALARALGHDVVGYTDASAARVTDAPVLGDDEAGVAAFCQRRCDAAVVGVGNTARDARRRLHARLEAAGIPLVTLVHPRASVDGSAAVGDGTAVFAGAIVGSSARVGKNCVLYSAAVVEHDCVLEDHAYLGPGVVLAGRVTVRTGAFLGAGAVVLPGVEIGADATVGAGAVVTELVTGGDTVIGAPARPRTAAAGR